MMETIETGSARIVGLKLRGTLHDEDYRQCIPQVEQILTAQGQVRLFVLFEDFHGWDLHAAWDDFKFGIRHYSDFERIALVGDRSWEMWMAAVCKPFTRAKVKYFDRSQSGAAWKWLCEEDQVERVEQNWDGNVEGAEHQQTWSRFPWYGF